MSQVNANVARMAGLDSQDKVLKHEETSQFRLKELFGSPEKPVKYDTFDQLVFKIKMVLKRANNNVHRMLYLKEAFSYQKETIDSFEVTYTVQNFLIVYGIIYCIKTFYLDDDNVDQDTIKTLITKWFSKSVCDNVMQSFDNLVYTENVLQLFEEEVEKMWRPRSTEYMQHVHESFKCTLVEKNSEQCSRTPKPTSELSGGKQYKMYKNRKYVLRTGAKGGKYILVKGEKVYV
jgi:hypothetical protein